MASPRSALGACDGCGQSISSSFKPYSWRDRGNPSSLPRTFVCTQIITSHAGTQELAGGIAVELTPREIVQELDRYIIGQEEAKRAVAIALRNRYRRAKLPPELREEVMPKNILMIGPTGVGKTEIARRLARLANAPFVKVEATKFTEVGYVGRDVESAVRELVDAAIRMVKEEKMRDVADEAERMAEDRIIDLFVPPPKRAGASNPLSLFWGMAEPKAAEPQPPLDEDKRREERERYRKLLRLGELETTW